MSMESEELHFKAGGIYWDPRGDLWSKWECLVCLKMDGQEVALGRRCSKFYGPDQTIEVNRNSEVGCRFLDPWPLWTEPTPEEIRDWSLSEMSKAIKELADRVKSLESLSKQGAASSKSGAPFGP